MMQPKPLDQQVVTVVGASSDFSTIATPRSLYNWLETHPAIRRGALGGAALGAITGLAARSVMSRG